MQPNILISSAGKRVELLLEFKNELKRLSPQSEVIAVDLNPEMSPACHIADKAFAVPRVTEPGYIDALVEICKGNNVRLVIPTIDTELLVLSENKDRFLEIGTHVMVSDPSFIKTCRDKRMTEKLFDTLGIRNPQKRDKYNPVFPMFAKPYDGSLSTNIHVLENAGDLTESILNDPKLMFMEYIDKSQYREYTVDMYYGADNRLKSVVPRERIEIRSGEINKGATRKNFIVNYLRERMESLTGVCGCICIQLFYRSCDNDVVGIEINPRYGGGYPLSYHAGAKFPAMMIKEYFSGEKLDYRDNWRDNTIMLRYDSQIII